MIKYRSFLAAAAVMLLVACGGDTEPTIANAPRTAPTAAMPEEEAPGAEAPAAQGMEPVEETVEETTAVVEDSEETIVLATAESDAASEMVSQKYSEGTHYNVLTTAQGTGSSPDVVEVAEVFWYGCPHCYNFDPYVARWEEELPDGVELVRLPVMWNPTNEIHARIFYTADALGKLDEMHSAIFQEMHLNGKTLTTESEIEALFVKFGVTPEEFQSTFRSFPVETRLKKAKTLTARYRVQSVPLLVINGKYVATGPGIKNFDDMISVANELIEREQAEL